MNSRENKDKVDKYNEGGRNRDIISDFHNYWCIFKRRWRPAVAVFGSIVVSVFMYTYSKAPIYKAQGQLLFKQDQTSLLIGLDSPEKVNFQNDRLQDEATESRVILSIPVLQKTLDLINKNNSYVKPLNLEELQQGLEIKHIEGTDIIQVAYRSKEPKLAALVVNQLINAYVSNNILIDRAAAISAGNFITGQLPMVKADVNRADAAISSFKEKYRITDFSQTQASIAANIERIKTQIDSVETQIADLNSRSTALQSQLGLSSQQAMALSSISQSPTVQGVLADLQEVERKLADAQSRYQESNPVLVGLKDKEVQLKTLLQNQIAEFLQDQNLESIGKLQFGRINEELMADLIKSEVNRRGLVTQMATLSKQQTFYQQKAAILPSLEQQQREQQRDLSAAQATYETLLKNLQ